MGQNITDNCSMKEKRKGRDGIAIDPFNKIVM